MDGLEYPLDDGLGDREYLRAVEGALNDTLKRFPNFDVILYQAGVDPLKSDRLGRLNVTHEGLAERDRMVNDFAGNSVSIISTCGGGYARHDDESAMEKVVTAHCNQIETLMRKFYD